MFEAKPISADSKPAGAGAVVGPSSVAGAGAAALAAPTVIKIPSLRIV